MSDSLKWVKARASGSSGGNCVEVAGHDSRVLVRDTKNRTGPMLKFTPDAWRRFAKQVKRSLALDSRPAPERGTPRESAPSLCSAPTCGHAGG